MAIATRCPHCNKTYKLKDELAGKRVNCTNPDCKKTFTVTATTNVNGTAQPKASPAKPVVRTAEDIALAALGGEDRAIAAKAESEKQIEAAPITVKCQFCDHVSTFEARMAGKNAPCQNEDCRKIIKIPVPTKNDPKDWRNVAKRPTAAKVNVEDMGGAWGNVQSQAVSREAILQAEIDEVEEAEPRSWAAVVVRAAIALAVLVLLVGGVVALLRYRAAGKQEKAMEMALTYVNGDAKSKTPKLKQEQAGVLHLLEGRYETARNQIDQAKNALVQARANVMLAQPSERAAALIEIACAQAELAGDPEQVAAGRRLDFKKGNLNTVLRQTLSALPQLQPPMNEDMRSYAFRKMTPIVVKSGNTGELKALANMSDDRPELDAVIGIELLALGQRDEALALAELASQQTGIETAHSLIALWLALSGSDIPEAKRKEAAAKAARIAPAPTEGGVVTPIMRVGYAAGWALKGKVDDARKLAWKSGEAQDRFRAGVAIAVVMAKSKDGAVADLEQCISALEKELKGQPVSPWLVLELVRLCGLAGKPELAARAAATIVDSPEAPGLKAWAQYEALLAKLDGAPKAPLDYELAKQIGTPDRLAHWLAWSAIARHNASIDSSATMKEIKSWSVEDQKPFGFAGVALAEH